MKSPLPQAIAYAAVQAYFQLSSATQWCQQIEDFDLVLLYDRIVNMFEGDSTNKQWAQETLDHWKLETPGLLRRGRSKARIDAGLHAFESEDDMDDFLNLMSAFLIVENRAHKIGLRTAAMQGTVTTP
ncbi:uncharacterized protein F5891DRAFT_1189289 [Suillus fuscotomentosus]|uniref:Uncharacterized protein n=1 Tax=Suillus fuscotomentosus TaxID=1912939 RepID=A0AAD4E591_9AGAM|nr:uncharacterized protein F5891DRAFT_1189289 [Suillus fuscotomentosus]KAG1899825.1 hypothetical protein F5891DRAFT_1189289 [Suillus fuscotomentosus]